MIACSHLPMSSSFCLSVYVLDFVCFVARAWQEYSASVNGRKKLSDTFLMSENIFNVFAILLNLIWASHFHCFTIYSADDHYLLWTLCNRHSSASEVHRGFNFDQFAFAITATDHCTILWCSYVRIGTSAWLPTPLSGHAQALLSSK